MRSSQTDGAVYDRYLSQLDVWATAFGCIIGWGAFVMPGTTFLPNAGPGGTIVAMVISAAIMLVIGKNYSFLMTHRPSTGGIYTYTKEALGRDHAFLCSWFLSLSYTSIVFLNATALFVVTRTLFGTAFQVGIHYQVSGHSVYVGEVLISILALFIVGFLFIRKKPLLQRMQTSLALILIAGVIIIALFALPHVDLTSLFSPANAGSRSFAPAVFTIVLLSPWAFVGFDVISLETAHFDFEVRKAGRLITLSVLSGTFVYIALTLVSIAAIPDGFATWQEYLTALDDLSGVSSVPSLYATAATMGIPGLVIAGVTALAAIFTGIIGAYRSTTRILSTLAEDNIVPGSFGSTTVSILFIMVISALVSFLGRNALEWFVDLTTFGALVGFACASLATYKLAIQEDDRTAQITGVIGMAITAVFGFVQLVPKVTPFDMMHSPSFLMLAFWCLLGFVFCWKTMSQGSVTEHTGYFMSSTALFALLLYSALMWYVLRLVDAAPSAEFAHTIGFNSIILIIIVFVGLLVMLYVQNLLRRRQDVLEREMIHAEETSRAKSQFLFNMSHDLRTPMNAVISLATLAQGEGITQDEKDEYLSKIESSGQQLLSIINDVLDMSRIESGKMELRPAPMNLLTSIEEQRDIFSAQMQTKQLDFVLDSSNVTDPWVLCDKNRLNRVLLNLLSNAFKFTPEGGQVSVTLRQIARVGDEGQYELRVRDTGIGMSEEFASRMFTPFERERTSTVSKAEGTGLGLAITKSIVDMMGGAINVMTAPDEGTEFVIYLTLPIVEEQDAPIEKRAPRDIDWTGTRLLLVEDIEINRQIAATILTKLGCTVDSVENGKEAVDAISESAPGTYDAVLMDIQMPVMDGYEATRAIRSLEDARLANIPIIAMTANAFKEDEEAAIQSGMQGHIAKPLEIDKMMATIALVLQK